MLRNIFSSKRTIPEGANAETILAVLAQDYMRDKRRRWLWRLLILLVIVLWLFAAAKIFTFSIEDQPELSHEKHAALVKLKGVVGSEQGIVASESIKILRAAFKAKNSKGVILLIDSPGGSPVVSAEINEEITRLRDKYPDKKIHTVVSDVCASGGYFIAAATDKIFANRSSLVGSIGVIYASFGFVDAIQKLGIERRVYTAGTNKSILDPFSTTREQDVEHLQALLDQTHQHFVDVVKQGRGERLADDEDIFSGLIWNGEEALKLGLIDGIGSLLSVAESEFDTSRIVDYSNKEGIFYQIARHIGASFAQYVVQAVEGGHELR